MCARGGESIGAKEMVCTELGVVAERFLPFDFTGCIARRLCAVFLPLLRCVCVYVCMRVYIDVFEEREEMTFGSMPRLLK